MNNSKNKPFIHLFCMTNKYFLFDVNTDCIVRIPQNTFFSLKNGILDDFSRVMIRQGFLKPNFERISKHPGTDFLDEYSKYKIGSLVLQTTQKCNFECDYCVYSGKYKNRIHSNKFMSKDIAYKSIDFLYENSGDLDEVSIAFYGGEPLLNFELIKESVEYANAIFEGVTINYNITTNGSLLNDQNMSFFEKNNFYILISLDGPEDIHDENRRFANSHKGSHYTILKNIKKMKENYKTIFRNLQINAVVDQRKGMKEVSDFFKNDEVLKNKDVIYSTITNNNAKLRIKSSEKFREENLNENFKLLLYKVGLINKGCISPLLKRESLIVGSSRIGKQFKKRNEISLYGHHGGPCIPGTRSLFINVEGKIFPCEKVSESLDDICMGDIKSGIDMEKMNRILNLERMTSEKCLKCWAYEYCTFCVSQVDIDSDGKMMTSNMEDICSRIRFYVEEEFKDYCALRLLGYDFETNNLLKFEGEADLDE